MREQAEALVRIAGYVEGQGFELAEVRADIAKCRESVAPVEAYFAAKNKAMAEADANHIKVGAARDATISAWLAWLTPRTSLVVLGVVWPVILSLLGAGTGAAGRLQAVVNALTTPVVVSSEKEPSDGTSAP